MELNTITITGRLACAVTLTASLAASGTGEDTSSVFSEEEGEITYDYVGE